MLLLLLTLTSRLGNIAEHTEWKRERSGRGLARAGQRQNDVHPGARDRARGGARRVRRAPGAPRARQTPAPCNSRRRVRGARGAPEATRSRGLSSLGDALLGALESRRQPPGNKSLCNPFPPTHLELSESEHIITVDANGGSVRATGRTARSEICCSQRLWLRHDGQLDGS